MENKPPSNGGIIIRRDLTILSFSNGVGVEIKLSPAEAISFANALVDTALQVALADGGVDVSAAYVAESMPCTH